MRRPRRHRPARDRRRGPQPRCNSGVRGRTSGLSRPSGNNGRPRNGSPNQPGSSRSPTGQARRHFGLARSSVNGVAAVAVEAVPEVIRPAHAEEQARARRAVGRDEKRAAKQAARVLAALEKQGSARAKGARQSGRSPKVKGALPNLSVRLWPAEVAAASGSAEPRHSLDLGGPWNPLPGARHLYRPPPAGA